VRLPSALALEAKFIENQVVELTVVDDGVLIRAQSINAPLWSSAWLFISPYKWKQQN